MPNAVATLAIPLAIFDKDVRPSATGDAAAVLAAKAQGVSIRKINDVDRMSDQSPPVPFDPKLPASA